MVKCIPVKVFYQDQLVTIYNLDCREVLPTLADGSVDYVLTDSPYGNKNHDGDLNDSLNQKRGLESKPIANDDAESMKAVVDAVLLDAPRFLNKEANAINWFCGGGGPNPHFAWLANRLDSQGLQFFMSCVFAKRNPGLGWKFRRQFELIMCGHVKDTKYLWADEDVAIGNVFTSSPPRERFHINEKPLDLLSSLITYHTKPGQLIIDPFAGSGTTGVAAKSLNRKCILVELEEKYCSIAARRLSQEYLF